MNNLTPLQINKISKVIALPSSMSNDPNYLNGQKLVDFFNEFGFGDDYRFPSIGIVTKDIGEGLSRQRYSFERLNKLTQMGKMPEVIGHFLKSVQKPEEVRRKIEEIFQQPMPHIDQSAYKNNYMSEDIPSLESTIKTEYTQFAGIKKDSIVVFISYAWDDEAHRRWVRKLSDDLRVKGIYTLLDDYNPGGVYLLDFMRKGIGMARRVLVIGSPKYKQKLDEGTASGVVFEDQIMTIEMFNGVKEKFIPILRKGTFKSSFSELMSVQTGYDFSDDTMYETQLKKLVADLNGNPLNAAPAVAMVHTITPPTTIEGNREWEKLFHYETLNPDETDDAYNCALEILKKPKTLKPFELAKLVFILCRFDNNGGVLSEEQYHIMEKAVEMKFNEASSFDELHEVKMSFYQTMDSCGYNHVNYASLSRLLTYLQSLLDRLKSEKKWLLVLYLEQLSEVNSKQLISLHNTAPDNGTPYSSMSLFDKVDINKMFDSLTSASPYALLNLRKFLVERYMLTYTLAVNNNSLEFNEDINNLSVLHTKLNDYITQLSPIAKLSYVDLVEIINKSIMRCKGDRSVLVFNGS